VGAMDHFKPESMVPIVPDDIRAVITSGPVGQTEPNFAIGIETGGICPAQFQARSSRHVDEAGSVETQQTCVAGHPDDSLSVAGHFMDWVWGPVGSGEIGKRLAIKRENSGRT